MDRLRLTWSSTSRQSRDPAQEQLVKDLILSLPASALKELLVEFATDPDAESGLDWLSLMAKRIGDLETERGLNWLVEQSAEIPAFAGLVRPALRGWTDSDPTGLLGVYFDSAKAYRFGIDERFDKGGGAKGMGAEIVAKAAEQSPGETWEILRKWQGKSLAAAFFDGVDPAQAEYFARKIKELLVDREKPGWEHLGGNELDWEKKQAALQSAATALFVRNPEHALAWFEDSVPILATTPEEQERERGQKAGELGTRLYREQPEQALAWIEGQAPGFRAAAASGLGYGILASEGIAEADFARLAILKGWIGEEAEQLAWIRGISKARAANGAGDLSEELVAQLTQGMNLTAEEEDALRPQWFGR